MAYNTTMPSLEKYLQNYLDKFDSAYFRALKTILYGALHPRTGGHKNVMCYTLAAFDSPCAVVSCKNGCYSATFLHIFMF